MKDLFLILIITAVFIAGPVGYVMNVVDLAKDDFKAPYKAEVMRVIGVAIPPIGAIEGLFVTFDKEKNHAA